MKIRITKICLTCTKEFEVIPARKKTAKYCSKSCLFTNPEVVKNKNKSLRGLTKSEKWKEEMSQRQKGVNNSHYSISPTLSGLHQRIRKLFPPPKFCQDCNKVPPLDLANISQEYKNDVNDWEWLCRKCHMTKDGRMKNLKQFSK